MAIVIPFLETSSFDIRAGWAADVDSHNFNLATDWDNLIHEELRAGEDCISTYYNWKYYRSSFRNNNPSFRRYPGALDEVADLYVSIDGTRIRHNGPSTGNFYIYPATLAVVAGGWDADLCTSRFYDGINTWPDYGSNHLHGPFDVQPTSCDHYRLNWTLPESATVDGWAWTYIGSYLPESYFDMVLINGHGIYFNTAGWNPNLTTGQHCEYTFINPYMKVRFCNPVVNSLSQYSMGYGATPTVYLYGHNFQPLETYADNGGSIPSGGFRAYVSKVDFVGLEGQGTTSLSRNITFFNDDDSTIRIPAMPALAEGLYEIQLEKNMLGRSAFYTTAGLARCDNTGAVTFGTRHYFYVGELSQERKSPWPMSEWRFKKADGEYVYKKYSTIDIRTMDEFYDGRIASMPAVSRSLMDRTGNPTIGNITVELANNDKEFSILMADHYLKGQPVQLSVSFDNNPTVFADGVYSGICEDLRLKGPKFVAEIRDAVQNYFKIKVPKELCLAADFPNIKEDHIGRPKPWALGLCSLTTTKEPGAIEAIYVDTTAYKYMAGKGRLKGVLEVYSAGTLKTETSHYTITYDTQHTYIEFNSSQGDNKITFNCQGLDAENNLDAAYSGWDSANGYIQNPARILHFFLLFMAQVPSAYIDEDSLDTLATFCEDQSIDEDGFLILQDRVDANKVAAEILFTLGAHGYHAASGLFTAKIVDVDNFMDNAIRVIAAVDCLDFPEREFGHRDSFNKLVAGHNYVPTSDHFQGAVEVTSETSQELYESEYEPDNDMEFKWIRNASWALDRAAAELQAASYGDKKVVVKLPLQYFGVELADVFLLADEWGISADGSGQQNQYILVEGLAFDFTNNTITARCRDISYMMSKYTVLGDRAILPDNWADANQDERLYLYLCDRATGTFADGEPGKQLPSRGAGT